MARSPDQVLAELLQIGPQGWAWPATPDSAWGRMQRPLADAIAALDARMEAMVPQADPRRATDLLDDFERVLGPDPAGRDTGAVSLGGRQALAWQRWTMQGGCFPGFYEALANASGVSITITEFASSPLGLLELGASPLAPEADDLTWRVTLPTEALTDFQLAYSELGLDPFGGFAPNPVQPVIELYQQPHTLLLFNYTTGP